jgi:O-antigen/teichoic acid export membrane protein
MKNRKLLSIIGLVSGITAFLMLFIIPFILIFFFPEETNNKIFAIIYFIIFLILTATGNITLEKSNLPVDVGEKRDKKLNNILKSK